MAWVSQFVVGDSHFPILMTLTRKNSIAARFGKRSMTVLLTPGNVCFVNFSDVVTTKLFFIFETPNHLIVGFMGTGNNLFFLFV